MLQSLLEEAFLALILAKFEGFIAHQYITHRVPGIAKINRHMPILQCYDAATLQYHNVMTLQHHNMTMLQCYNITILQCHNIAFHHITMFQCHNIMMLLHWSISML